MLRKFAVELKTIKPKKYDKEGRRKNGRRFDY